MRIGILSQWFDPETGGAALPGVLARSLRDRGHEIQVLTGFPNYPLGRLYSGYHMRRRTDEVVDGIAVRRVALYPAHGGAAIKRALNFSSFAASASLSGIGAFRNVDAIWAYNSPATVSAAAGLSKLLLKRPHVLHVMDLWPDSILAAGFARPGPAFDLAKKGLDAWCDRTYAWASSVAYITPGVGQALADRGVPQHKLRYVPVWTDEMIFRPIDDRSLRSELGLTDKVVMVYAGALGSIQGLETLIDACSRVSDLGDFHCLVAGSGAAEGALRARAESLGLVNITFLGQLAKADMPRLMAAGDIHLVSLRPDALSAITLPSKIQATLACARPAIVAIEGDAAKVARDSGAGFPIKPGDVEAMEQAIRAAHRMGPHALAHMGRLGRTYYETEFSVEIAVGRVEQLLREAAGV